tara:strand:- start:1640 stop:2101 length:462 start_codon:yes stop_codon:yes gene_type:complete
MSVNCIHCDTRENVIVPKQLSAEDDVSSGRITEGKYLEICKITKKLYENLMVLCFCKEQEEEEEDEDSIDVSILTVTTDNTKHLVGLPGDFLDKYLNEEIYVSERLYNNNMKFVVLPVNLLPFRHIYYDSTDNQFKELLNWFDDFVGNVAFDA